MSGSAFRLNVGWSRRDEGWFGGEYHFGRDESGGGGRTKVRVEEILLKKSWIAKGGSAL